MAVEITVADLASAIRVGTTSAETAQVTRVRAYAIEAISHHLGDAYADAPVVVVNEAAVRLGAYLYDAPTISGRDGFAFAMRSSGAGRMLLPYVVHNLGSTGTAATAAAQAAVGTQSNPVTGISISGQTLTVTFQDGTTTDETLPAPMTEGAGIDEPARTAAQTAQETADAAQTAADTAATAAGNAQGAIDAHAATAHNTDQTARDAAAAAQSTADGAATSAAAAQTAADGKTDAATVARLIDEHAADADAHHVPPVGGGRVELFKDTSDYTRSNSTTIYRQVGLSRAPAPGRGLELVIANVGKLLTVPLYCGSTDDWLGLTPLTASQLDGVLIGGAVGVENTIPVKSVSLGEINSDAFGHGIVYVGRVSDTGIGVAIAQNRGLNERFRMTVREIP